MSIANVSKQIQEARKEHGWSQNDLANHAHVSRPTIARAESGQDISTVSLGKITEALELVIDLKRSE